MFIVMFDFIQDGTRNKLIGVRIKCNNCKRVVQLNMTDKQGKDIITIFINAIVFQNFGIYWLTE